MVAMAKVSTEKQAGKPSAGESPTSASHDSPMTVSSTHVSFVIRGHLIPFHRDVSDGDDFCLENATIQDFLEDVAEYHEIQCGCLVNIGSHVWLTSDPLDEAAMLNDPPAAKDALALHSRLDSLRGPHTPNLSLLIDGEALEFGTNEFLRLAREKLFISFRHEAATVFRRHGSNATLPSANVPSYQSFCATPGSVFVDKSAFVRSLLVRFSSSRVNIIRRPRGFGKTTFLSMIDAYFDPESSHAHFPFMFQPELVSKSLFAARRQMLIFSLDFAELHLHDDAYEDDDMLEIEEDEDDEQDDSEQYMSEDEYMSGDEAVRSYLSEADLDAKCYAFLDVAARAFYTRYQDILRRHAKVENRGGRAITFTDIIRWSKQADYSLVFLIDNYTAPLHIIDPRFRAAVTVNILKFFDKLIARRTISYGLLVGEDIPGAKAWPGMPLTWSDLSDYPELSAAIGFTHSEVVALGQAISVDLLPTLKSSLPVDQRNDTRLLYAPADVLAIARRLMGANMPSALTATVRTLKPPRVEEVPRNIPGQCFEALFGSGSWPDPMDEGDVDI